MLNIADHPVLACDAEEQARLEALIRDDFAACHPGDTLDDIKRRARFSKEDRGLLQEWMAVAAARTAALARGAAAE